MADNTLHARDSTKMLVQGQCEPDSSSQHRHAQLRARACALLSNLPTVLNQNLTMGAW